MISVAGERLAVSGALTLANARELLETGSAKLTRPENIFDLAAVEEVDSSGLTVVFGWVRAAARLGQRVKIANPPQDLLSLAELYGVSDLIPLA